MILASPGFFLSLVHVLLVIATLSTVTSQKITTNASSSGASNADSKCHNMYMSNNFYAGPNKKIKTLLREVIRDFSEIREEIKSLKENKTICEGM